MVGMRIAVTVMVTVLRTTNPGIGAILATTGHLVDVMIGHVIMTGIV